MRALHHARSAFAILHTHPDRLALFVRQESEGALEEEVLSFTDDFKNLLFVALDDEEWAELLAATAIPAQASGGSVAFGYLIAYDRSVLATFNTVEEVKENVFSIAKAFRSRVRRLVVNHANELARHEPAAEPEAPPSPAAAQDTRQTSQPFPDIDESPPQLTVTSNPVKRKVEAQPQVNKDPNPFHLSASAPKAASPALERTVGPLRLAVSYPDGTRTKFTGVDPNTSLLEFASDQVLPLNFPNRDQHLRRGAFVEVATRRALGIVEHAATSLVDLGIESGSTLALQALPVSYPGSGAVAAHGGNSRLLALKENTVYFLYLLWDWLLSVLLFFKRLFTGRA